MKTEEEIKISNETRNQLDMLKNLSRGEIY